MDEELREQIFKYLREAQETPEVTQLIPIVYKVEQLITARDAAKEREQAFPFKETYDFLYNNHKDVLEELQEHIAELRRESDLVRTKEDGNG